MFDVELQLPPRWLIATSVALVWAYEGFWCKLLRRSPDQLRVVEAVPAFEPRYAAYLLSVIGAVEVMLAVWVLWGVFPVLCVVVQTLLLVSMNTGGVIWARQQIHDPPGMLIKNAAFLLLAWVGAALGSAA